MLLLSVSYDNEINSFYSVEECNGKHEKDYHQSKSFVYKLGQNYDLLNFSKSFWAL